MSPQPNLSNYTEAGLDKYELMKHNRNVGLTLASVGIKVFPSVDKTPRVAAWQLNGDAMSPEQKSTIRDEKQAKSGYRHKFIGSTSDPKTIKAMMREYPNATFSIALGPSGLICLDADLPKPKRPLHGPTELAKLYTENGGKPAGVFVSKSQSGAEHHVYANPNRIRSGGALASLSIDIKGGGLEEDSGTGQIVAPGSIRGSDGKHYGRPDAAKRLADAYVLGLPELPGYIVDRIARGPSGRSGESRTAISNAEEADTFKQLRKAGLDDTANVDTDTALMFDPAELYTAYQTFLDLPVRHDGERFKDTSTSADRFRFLQMVRAMYPDMLAGEGLAVCCCLSETPNLDDVVGDYIGNHSKDGETGIFTLREFVRDWTKSKYSRFNPGLPTDGAAFGEVEE